MNRNRTLDQLCAALRGEPPPQANWPAVLSLANSALVTPQVHRALTESGGIGRLPADVAAFTAEVHRRNRERNQRLAGQLTEAVATLNAAGIRPTLLKGAALWPEPERLVASDRMLNDLDLLVRPAEADRAVAALVEAGFAARNTYPGEEVHVVAELGRPQDVGFIDLHQRPPGPPGMAELPDLDALCEPVTWEGVQAQAPQPAIQAFFLVLHDQFHDGDYWRGGFTLRHLMDLTELVRRPFDWGVLERLTPSPLVRHAVAAQLMAAHCMFGAELPGARASDAWARLQHLRHRAQFAWPGLAAPLAALGAASEWSSLLVHRRMNRRDRARMFGAAAAAAPLGERLGRMRRIMGGFAHGKL